MTESQETQAQPALPTRADLATSGLTKRNQEFIWQMVQLVDGDASKAGLIAEVGQSCWTVKRRVPQRSNCLTRQLKHWASRQSKRLKRLPVVMPRTASGH
ncbi:hypothetical protein K8375_02790 [Weissella cibaria]|uniref:hypothetical protein n=1 Tax=Weissella cibaria TaxID=137591 RepID=UPI001CC339E6|nr:hypothetical protein [Weissella cibaria]MBZ6069076.1 hypothetical protein [Weissella cibaria]